MWRVSGSIILVFVGLFNVYWACSAIVRWPYGTLAEQLRAAVPGVIAIVVGVGQYVKLRWAWSNTMWLIAGSALLIFGGGVWVVYGLAMGAVVGAESHGKVDYWSEVIPFVTPGLVSIVVGVGQLIRK
jgi:hypothetical protein